ncbi:hypothetical protein PVAND_005925 [Polypedilum vanderplanki]|uniref:GCN5-related N-acetyltransferase Rv2170-like domain-containing protein n=1 Tax=Polypedilum vanderplanki TaxID=319348 RepID=A0A9J6C207_POLVA|nr:hypothetical protein PVAND_005925 [Polypedilum vanderplanki]
MLGLIDFEQSELFIDYSIKYHISMGLFDSNDNLIAWCLRYDNGSLGVLQVDQKHLRKGFGEIVVRAMIKKIAEFCNLKIPIESLPSLRDSYRVNWPEYIGAFNLIDNLIERFTKYPEQMQIQEIFSVDGDISDSTIIVILNDKDIILETLDPEFKLLKIGIRLINFSKMKMFMAAKSIYRKIIMEMIEEKNLKLLFEDKTIMVHIKKEDAVKLEIKTTDKIEIKNLSLSDAEKINSVWPFASPESIDFIRYAITYNKSVGLYEKSSKELVAWCLENDCYSLLALQTDDKNFRKGFGILAAKAITKKIAEERNVDVITNIVCENYKSKNLFDKIGFKPINSNLWIGVIEN